MYFFHLDSGRVALTTTIAQRSEIELQDSSCVAVLRRGNPAWSSPPGTLAMAEAWRNTISLLNSSVSMALAYDVSKRRIRRTPKAEGGIPKKGKIATCKENPLKNIDGLLQAVGPVEAGQLLRLLEQAVHAQTIHIKRRKDFLLQHAERALITQVSQLLNYVERYRPLVGKRLFQGETKFGQHLCSIERKRTSSQSAGSPPNWPIKNRILLNLEQVGWGTVS